MNKTGRNQDTSLHRSVKILAFSWKKRYCEGMKFYENLSPDERKIMVYKTVAFSNALEGMNAPADQLIERVKTIESQRKKLTKALNPSTQGSK